MAALSTVTTYCYVAVPLINKQRIPYRARLLVRDISEACHEVEARCPGWRPDIYRVFVYSLREPSEYQAVEIAVHEDGSYDSGKFPPSLAGEDVGTGPLVH